jgi:hypothetical protein
MYPKKLPNECFYQYKQKEASLGIFHKKTPIL